MTSRVNLVAILLTLCCLAAALTQRDPRRHFTEKRVVKGLHTEIHPVIGARSSNTAVTQEKIHRVHDDSNVNDLSMRDEDARESARGKKKNMDRTMMALLMAYKMKFIALIPTLLGGLALLKGTALLAGFFFALFAAVLGLKVH